MKPRIVESAITRLRLGHAGLRTYLHKFKISNSDLCECGELETINHFLFYCRLHRTYRDELGASLNIYNVALTRKNLLGGGKYPVPIQMYIREQIGKYIIRTKKLSSL